MSTFSDLWEKIDYHSHREQLKETFGHLAPEKNKTYKGRIVYAVGCFADDRLNPVAIVAEFDGLESSPWFFEAVMDFLNGGNAPTGYDGFSYMIGDLKNEDGCIYEWVGTLRNYKFTGQRRLLLNVNQDNHSVISFRHPYHLEPSARELERYRDDPRELADIRAEIKAEDPYYESEFALKVGKLIVTAINELPDLLAENRRLREALETKQGSVEATPFGRAVLRSIPVYDPDKIPEQPRRAEKTSPPKEQKSKPRRRAKQK